MAINLPVPQNLDYGLYQLLTSILRRALDVSINPAIMNVGLKVTGNDITIATAGNGFVLPCRDGSKTYRIVIENDGTISADRLT